VKRSLLALLVLVGCGGDERSPAFTKATVKLEDVPENIRKIAEKEMSESKLMDAFKKSKKDGTFLSYEIRAKNLKTGKINEVGIAPDGTIVDRE
jgi:hypothetical protein